MIFLRILLLLSTLEGIVALYALALIPADPTNVWLLGLSAARWVTLIAIFAGVVTLVFLLLKSWRNPEWFSTLIIGVKNQLNQKKGWLGVSFALFFSFTTAYSLALLIPMLLPGYRVLITRLMPMIMWALILMLQSLVAIAYLYIQERKINVWAGIKSIKLSRVAINLFLVSLLIRTVLAAAVISFDVQPAFDETGYNGLAIGINGIMDDLASGSSPTTDNLDTAYGDGRWPPLHPFVLAMGYFFFGSTVAAARFAMVIVSSLTTPLVYLITKKISNEKSAFFASLVHIIYPSFLAYSHYLWSETTFIFLLLLTLYTLILLIETQSGDQKFFLAAACGLFLGLGTLTRSAMLPYIFVVPLWLLFTEKDRWWKYAAPAVTLSLVAVTTLPWIYTMTMREGELTVLGTNGGYTLYLSNNPWLPEESFRSSMEFRSTREQVLDSVDEFRRSISVSNGAAANILAKEEISQNPGDFVIRSLERVRYFISGDSFIVRHFVHAVYPPVSNILIALVWLFALTGFILFLSFTSFGLFTKKSTISHRSLIILLTLTGMALPAITIANSRYYLPVLATLLPITGVGIFNYLQFGARKKVIALGVSMALFGLLVITTVPNYIQNNLRPSIYYSDLISKIDIYFGGNPQYSDRFEIRNVGAAADIITITIVGDGYLFRWRETQTLDSRLLEPNGRIKFDIYSTTASGQLEIIVYSENSGKSIKFSPLDESGWNNWLDLGLENIEYIWIGGGF